MSSEHIILTEQERLTVCMLQICVLCVMHVDELMHMQRHTAEGVNLLSKVTLLFSVRSRRTERDREETGV